MNNKYFSNGNSNPGNEYKVNGMARDRKDINIRKLLNMLKSKNYQLVNSNLTKILKFDSGNFILDDYKSIQILSVEKTIELLLSNRFTAEKSIKTYIDKNSIRKNNTIIINNNSNNSNETYNYGKKKFVDCYN